MEILENIGFFWCLLLVGASFVGGILGTLSGGSGMITMPLLLLSGISPIQALATNKLQACFGSFTGALHYYKSGLVDLGQSRSYMLIAFVFSGIGTLAVQYISPDRLSVLLPFAMIGVGLYLLFAKNLGDDNHTRQTHPVVLYVFCALAGLYGGLLGVGIGTFVIAILISMGGYGFRKALAHSRWIVFSINFISMLVFIISGHVLWLLGVMMCIGQLLGSSLGAKMAIKHGAKLIRPLVIGLCFVMSIQLLIKQF